ncbi:MAG: L-lactate permease [Bacillota bacterium]
MPPGPPVTAWSWLAGAAPLMVLLTALLKLKWKAPRAGGVAWAVALALGWAVYRAPAGMLAVGSAKGLSLTLFVVLIIWASVLLYNLVEKSGAMEVIAGGASRLVRDELLLFIFLAWCLSALVQGVAGFGVPVAIVAPLMVAVGFSPLQSVVATLVGHAWSISFGSMGASYYTLQLVTRMPGQVIGLWMGIMLALPTVLSGVAVAHIYDGWKAVRRALPWVLTAGPVMAVVMTLAPVAGAPQLATILAALAGSMVLSLWSRYMAAGQPAAGRRGCGQLGWAFFPYLLLIVLTLASQLGPVKALVGHVKFGLNYPAAVTGLGYQVPAERAYAAIGLFSHPAPLILLSTAAAFALYLRLGHSSWTTLTKAWAITQEQCTSTTVSIATMVMMALVMNDSGMTSTLARGVAAATGRLFPLFSPAVGVLGCFMTGSNTNSNVLFGAFQMETAAALGVSTRILAAAQSAGGSLGSAIAPAKVLIGTATTGLTGQESLVMKRAIPYSLAIVGSLGALTWVLVYLVFTSLP